MKHKAFAKKLERSVLARFRLATMPHDMTFQQSPVYEVSIEGEQPVTMTAAGIASAWETNIPAFAARVLDLLPGAVATLFDSPRVDVRRIA